MTVSKAFHHFLPRRVLLILIIVGCTRGGIVVYAPPEFARAAIVVNGKVIGSLDASQRGYRWVGWKRLNEEFGRPPRSESRGALRLQRGDYVIELRQTGYVPITRRVRYDGERPSSLDFSADFVTPLILWAEEPDGDRIASTGSTQFTRALTMAADGDSSGALRVFQELANTHQDPGVELNVALCLWNVGERRRALAILDEMTHQHPDYWPATYDEAILYLLIGQIEPARTLTQQLQRLIPTHPGYVRLASALVSRSGG